MELYKWYKGDELPTEECDCVVVFRSTGNMIWIHRELGRVCFDTLTHRLRIACPDRGFNDWGPRIISEKRIKAWMPIEFPKEV